MITEVIINVMVCMLNFLIDVMFKCVPKENKFCPPFWNVLVQPRIYTFKVAFSIDIY